MALSNVAAALTEPDGGVPHRTCQVCHYESALSPEDLATFHAILRNRGIKYVQIHEAFRDDPELPTLDYSSIRRHGNGEGSHEVKFR